MFTHFATLFFIIIVCFLKRLTDSFVCILGGIAAEHHHREHHHSLRIFMMEALEYICLVEGGNGLFIYLFTLCMRRREPLTLFA
jgi:hypothetical protein